VDLSILSAGDGYVMSVMLIVVHMMHVMNIM
jgi:hypothetical protein